MQKNRSWNPPPYLSRKIKQKSRQISSFSINGNGQASPKIKQTKLKGQNHTGTSEK